jgi:hypothetical protein
MIRIVVQNDVAEQVRHSGGQIELVDGQGQRLGVVNWEVILSLEAN